MPTWIWVDFDGFLGFSQKVVGKAPRFLYAIRFAVFWGVDWAPTHPPTKSGTLKIFGCPWKIIEIFLSPQRSKITFQARWAWLLQLGGINSEPHESGIYRDQLDELSSKIPISNRFDEFWKFRLFSIFSHFWPDGPQAWKKVFRLFKRA